MESTEIVGRDAAVLSLVEVGLGSVLHALHVPLAGHLLSLNQGFILTRAVKSARGLDGSRGVALEISNVAATLKSLAPAGKKLTPMLAISAQGFLYSLGTFVFGPTAAGALVGAALASVWGFVQPVLVYYVLFGKVVADLAGFLMQKQASVAVAALIALKLVAALAAAAAGWFLPETVVQRYLDRMTAAARSRATPKKAPKPVGRARQALRELFNPLFVVSLVLTGVFFFFAEGGAVPAIWAVLRPIAIGFVLFFGFKLLPLHRSRAVSAALARFESMR